VAALRRSAFCLLLSACADHHLAAVRGESCLARPEQAACAKDTWPNSYSQANSDPWLDSHADSLREMHPRVTVLNFHNPLASADLRAVAERQVEALSEGSRYHGYLDPNAPPFLHYELSSIVDLRDETAPAEWKHTSSTRVPLNDAGAFDVPALFGEPYTSLMGVEDPSEPGRMLDLCTQFERGLVHELWLAVGDTETGREPPSMIECKVARDESGKRTDGPPVATGAPRVCAQLPPCDVTIRIAHLSPLRGVGCDLVVRAWAIHGSTKVIPYLKQNATRFFNDDLDTRYGAPVANLDDLCAGGVTPCVQYPTSTSLESVVDGGPRFRLENYGRGCGAPEFPPNAATKWDYESKTVVNARCEHYGLGDAQDGSDLPSPYSFDTVSALAADYTDCGGAWQIYVRQSMPGLDNKAHDAQGQPMRNWWPFLFY
jgi:hypothetical protein